MNKFKENLFKGEGDVERTRNARLKHVTFSCDLGFESAWLNYVFCTPPLCGDNSTKLNENPFSD